MQDIFGHICQKIITRRKRIQIKKFKLKIKLFFLDNIQVAERQEIIKKKRKRG